MSEAVLPQDFLMFIILLERRQLSNVMVPAEQGSVFSFVLTQHTERL
jgi:hypothetical protein